MGGGVAGWLTPGWMTNDHRLSPHIATPSKTLLPRNILTITKYFRLCESYAQGRREPKRIVDWRLQAPVQILERQVEPLRKRSWGHYQDQPYQDLHVSHERLRDVCWGMRAAPNSQPSRRHSLSVFMDTSKHSDTMARSPLRAACEGLLLLFDW